MKKGIAVFLLTLLAAANAFALGPFPTGHYSALGLPQLMTIATENRIPSDQDENSTRNAFLFRSDYYIGQDAKDLVVRFDNWTMGSDGIIAVPNSFTLTSVALECPNGVVVPVTFNGSRSITLASDAVDVRADKIPASACGLAQISKATTLWLKGKGTVPLVNDSVPISQDMTVNNFTGRQLSFYNEGETSVTATDSTGKYTGTGTALFNRLGLFRPFLWGTPVGTPATFGIVGDSISAGFADVGELQKGKGFFPRACYGTDGNDPRACLVLARGGTNSTHYANVPRILALYPYAKYWMEGMATNDFGATGGVTAAGLMTRKQGLWQNMRDNGAAGIFGIQVFYRTTSTDNFATTANQTYTSTPVWGPSGSADQIDAWLQTLVGNQLVAVVSTAATRDATETRKALVNGTASYSTSDGVHPRNVVNIPMGATLATQMRAVP